jgi:hypothetical protein
MKRVWTALWAMNALEEIAKCRYQKPKAVFRSDG